MSSLPINAWRTHWRKRAKAAVKNLRASYVRRWRSYDAPALVDALASLGVRQGDALMLHSGFSEAHGLRGTIDDLIGAFRTAIGPNGHLLMVSLPYRDATFAYLQRGKRFDVRRTPSMMGMVSELFRRRPDVLRSLHPTHPILAQGPRAQWLVDGHEERVHPCGPDTPFARFAELDGAAVFFNVPFANFTFFHHLEHLVHERLPFPLYTAEVYETEIVDADGQVRRIRTHAFHPDVFAHRRFAVLESWLREAGLIHARHIGATTLELVRVREAMALVEAKARAGQFFYASETTAPPRT